MNLCDRNDIQALLARHGFRFAKSLGQNFLIEGWVAEDIAAAGCPEGCGVLEVGPGIGALTVQLARRAEKVVSVELDRRLPPVLAETMADCPNFTLVEGDVMQQDLSALVRQHLAACGRCCAPTCPTTSPRRFSPPAWNPTASTA